MAHHVVVTGAAANGGQRNARLAALACAAALLTLVVALAVNGDGKDEVGGGRRRNVLFQWETRNDPAEVGMSDLIKGADADDPAFKLSDFSLYPRTERMTQSAETRCPMCTGTNAYYKWERDAYKGTNDLLAPAAAAAAATGPVPISESSSGSAQMMAPIAPPAPKTAAEVRGESLGTADAGVRNRAEAYGRMLQRIGSKMSEVIIIIIPDKTS